jgi:predicted enzyme related to lactoylglutathione lyase
MPAKLVHFEMPAQNADRAREFYSKLFDWKFRDFEGPVEYHMLEEGIEPGGAVYPSESGEKGPIVYFGVEDIRKEVGHVRELGGQADDPQPIPTVGWFARCTDTEGNAFSLFQPDESVPMPGGPGAS